VSVLVTHSSPHLPGAEPYPSVLTEFVWWLILMPKAHMVDN
jgi:hypothetical protein